MRRVAKLLEKVDALALAEGQEQAPVPVTTDEQLRERVRLFVGWLVVVCGGWIEIGRAVPSHSPLRRSAAHSNLRYARQEEGAIQPLAPGQWRVLHPTLTALALTLHDVYYDFPGRMNEALVALGLAARLTAAGAKTGDALVVTPPRVAASGGGGVSGAEEEIAVVFVPPEAVEEEGEGEGA